MPTLISQVLLILYFCKNLHKKRFESHDLQNQAERGEMISESYIWLKMGDDCEGGLIL